MPEATMTKADSAVTQLSGDPALDPVRRRLDDQLDWYERRSLQAQRAYKRVKLIELVVAAAVPVLAGLRAPAAVTAAFAAVVVVLEGVQQLFQWQTNWLQYRSTAEALKHEKFLYEAGAEPYNDSAARQRLAERIEALLVKEHGQWEHSQQGRRSAEERASASAP
jgi:hypothetical protein